MTKIISDECEEISDWANEHGEPDFQYLQSLLTDPSQSAFVKLCSIAADLDVTFTSNTTKRKLVDLIRSATKSNNNDSGFSESQ